MFPSSDEDSLAPDTKTYHIGEMGRLEPVFCQFTHFLCTTATPSFEKMYHIHDNSQTIIIFFVFSIAEKGRVVNRLMEAICTVCHLF